MKMKYNNRTKDYLSTLHDNTSLGNSIKWLEVLNYAFSRLFFFSVFLF